MILLYRQEETDFLNNGLGALSDAVSCEVTEERNGAFELEMEYPITGIHYTEIKSRRIIVAKPDPYRNPQPFRIYRITKPISGRVKVYAQHISYDLSGVTVAPFTAGSAAGAFTEMEANATDNNIFSFETDVHASGTMTVSTPSSARALLGGQQGSVLDVYGGEYEWDKLTVKLKSRRGQNSGVTIRYGKNLTNLEQDENISSVATGVYPYWLGGEGELVTLPEKTVNAPGTYDFEHIVPLDLSGEFENQPTADMLRERAEQYVNANNIGVPSVSIKVAFQPLEQTEEYKDIALLEKVNLCDTVTVEYPALGVSATAKCVRTVYDVLKRKYISVELGDAKTNIADTIVEQQKEIEKVPTISIIQQAINSATDLITGNKGGYVVLHDTNGDGEPDEILVMDSPAVETAMKIWRWNSGGFGYSKNGYNGPYETAITMDGTIIGKFIAGLTIAGSQIISGIIKSEARPEVYFDLDAGSLHCDELVSTTNSATKMRARITSRTDSGQLSDEFSVFYGNEKIFRVHPTPSGFLDIYLRNGWELSVWPDGYLAVNMPNGSGGTKTGLIIRQDKIDFYLPIYDKDGKEIKGA
ncbi:MAG: hypothetical protein DBX97_25095 [Collinsella tanakaei]|nr:MAG: hypothetical protein DBX97_25095 [Collinsella tanakaei]